MAILVGLAVLIIVVWLIGGGGDDDHRLDGGAGTNQEGW
jgi:hypothetical protein